MASTLKARFRVSAQDATTVTLVPVAGETIKPDLSNEISQIVITMTARDTQMFDVTNRQFDIELYRK